MEIKKAVELEDGTYVFQGKLEGAELRIVVETGLNTLLANGIIPFIVSEDETLDVSVMVPPEGVQ